MEEKGKDVRKLSSTRPMSFTRKPVPEAASKPVSILSASPELKEPLPVISPLASSPPVAEPVKPASTWELDSPTLGVHYGVGSPTNFSLVASSWDDSRDISPSSRPDGPISREIRHQREVIKFRVTANDEFLEKRRRSKINFQNELRKSISSDERSSGGRVSEGSSFSFSAYEGPISPVSPMMSRESRASVGGHENFMTRQRSQGQVSRSSRTSSLVQGSLHRADSQASEDSLFGLRAASPLTPPSVPARNIHRRTLTGNLATTLQLPDFGKGVEPGIEVVNGIDHENGLMLANENKVVNTFTPAASVVSVEHQIRHDTSFYKFGGFCEGSKMLLKGEVSYKQMKRPAGNFSSIISAKCLKCSYEASWNSIQHDLKLDRTSSVPLTVIT